MENFDAYTLNAAKEVAERINDSDTWIPEDLELLCKLAGMEEDWAESDGDTFEQVVYAAADALGVEI